MTTGDPHGSVRLVTGDPAALEDAFLKRVGDLRAADPMAPIDVLVGGVLMRPYLQRLIAETSPGMLNVRVSTIGELGVRLGEATLSRSGRRPLPALAERALVRHVASECAGYFAPVAATPGFADAVRRLLRELRQEGVDAPAFRAAAGHDMESAAKGDDLAALYERYVDRRAATFDGIDALGVADADGFDGAALLVFGVWRLGAAGRRLVGQIAGRVPVTVYLPALGAATDGAHEELRAWLAGLGVGTEHVRSAPRGTALGALQRDLFTPVAATGADATVDLVSAPDPQAEVREAARACLAWAGQGVPFRQMAVAYRQADVYRPLVEATFAEAGIPVYLDDGPRLAERPLGRRILALLELIDSPLRRRDVIGFLSDGRMPQATRDRFGGARVSQWDSLSRRAGVVAGADQWRARLGGLRERSQRDVDENPDREWLRSYVEGCDHLIAFVDELAARLDSRPATATWSASVAWVRELIATYVDGAERVLGYLDGVAGLDALLPPVAFARFVQVVRAEVREMSADEPDGQSQGAFGRRGVNVLDVNQLRHLRFDAVAVLGLTERSFPPPPRQDPLLLDDERIRLNARAGWTLPLRSLGADSEPLQFALAVHAARERLLLSTRRADQPGGRMELPSAFFREALSALVGERVPVDKVEHHTEHVRRLRAGVVGADHPDRALTVIERDRTLLETDPQVGRAVLARLEQRAVRAEALRRARWGARELTPFDGAFAGSDALAKLEDALQAGSIVSPTRLETYAGCPRRYWFAAVLRLRPLEEPEDLLRISPMERGSQVHRILELFIRSLPDGTLAGASASDHRERLLHIAAEELDGAERMGLTGAPLLWNVDRAEILQDLERWLERELADGGGYGAHGVEVAFGGRFHAGDSSPLDTEDMLELPTGARTLRFRGRVDRLDYTPGERFRVVDYKTGRGSGLPKDGMLGGGTALQLPIYLRAGELILGIPAATGEAAYHLVSRAGGFRRIAFTGEHLTERAADLDAILERIGDGIAGGDFHAEPSSSCRYCDFADICDVSRAAQRERKADDPRIVSFAQMKEIP